MESFVKTVNSCHNPCEVVLKGKLNLKLGLFHLLKEVAIHMTDS